MKQHANYALGIGFTLVETLVVLTIMSIMLGLVIANWGLDEKQQLQQESRRLALLMAHASATARSTGRPIAWSSSQHGYQFLQPNTSRNNWQVVSTDSTLRSRQLPAGIQISEQRIEGNRLSKNEMIIFSPSGLNAAFSITLSSAGAITKLKGNLLGNIQEEAVWGKTNAN